MKLEEEYRKIKTDLDEFGISLKTELNSLIPPIDIKLAFPVQQRTKSLDSIQNKIDNPKLRIKSLQEIQDLVGIRIILLFKKDIEIVRTIIRENFDIVKEYDTLNRLQTTEFGYSSIHFVVKLASDWIKIPSLKKFKDLKAEIQLRTLSQHLWAEASHHLNYKSKDDVHISVVRSLHRLSAVLELTDLELERVLNQRESYIESIKNKITSSEKINVDILEVRMKDQLPKENDISNYKDYNKLLNELIESKIITVAELENLFSTYLVKALEKDKEVAKKYVDNYYEKYKHSKNSKLELALKGIHYSHSGLLRIMIKLMNGDKEN